MGELQMGKVGESLAVLPPINLLEMYSSITQIFFSLLTTHFLVEMKQW